MKTKNKILYVLGILLSLGLAFAMVYIRLLSEADLIWFVMLSGALLGAFGLELWKSINGRKISWDLYNPVDKILFFYSAGYMLGWLPIYIFGSEPLKKNWLWQHRDSDM